MANFYINKSIIGGKLVADVELKTTPSGVSVCSFTIAVARKFKRDETDFINCVAWRNAAELISKFFRKGSSICIVGNTQTRNYDDKEGKKVYVTEVVVEEVFFVDSKSEVQGAEVQEVAPPKFDVSEGFVPIGDDTLPF